MPRAGIERLDWYDVPRFYDIVFDADTRREGAFLAAVLAEYGPKAGGKRVLEPACGSGRLVAEMSRRGYAVTGFDLNPHMLAYARTRLARRGLPGRLARRDMAHFDLGRGFHLAHCLVSTFKYLLDEDAARTHLECTARALVEGGLYVVGLHLTRYERKERQRERWVERRGRTVVTCNTEVGLPVRRSRLERVRTRLRVETAGGERRFETRWEFRTYDARQFRRLLTRVPAFEIAAVHDFTYEIERTRELDDGRADKVVVLRKL